MTSRLDPTALATLFPDARTHNAWQPNDVPDGLLREVVDLMKMGADQRQLRARRASCS